MPVKADILLEDKLRNQGVIVVKRASGIPEPDTFAVVELPEPLCMPGSVLVEVLFAAVDPAMRGWVSTENNYMTVPDRGLMRAVGVGRVIESQSEKWAVGDALVGWFGWQQIAAPAAEDIFWKADLNLAPAETWLSALGLNGLAAWIGFRDFGRPRPNETIVVSTAAGGVGSVVGQLARAAELRAVGLTSSPDKVALLIEEYGYSVAIDYRQEAALNDALSTACPRGIDIFFDNTGGGIADAVFPHLNCGARVIQCGTAAIASWTDPPLGLRRERDVLVKRLSWNGFIITDFASDFPQALDSLKAMWRLGKLRAKHDYIEGLVEAPLALGRLYSSSNVGRLVVRVA